MAIKRKDCFTYVITFTFIENHKKIADEFISYIQSPIDKDGLGAMNIDQSTYASLREIDTTSLLCKLKKKVDELYLENGLKKDKGDVVYLLCNPTRAWEGEVNFPKNIYRFDIFDFEKK